MDLIFYIDIAIFISVIGGIVGALMYQGALTRFVKKKLHGEPEPLPEPKPEDNPYNSNKTFHRCPNQKCGALVERPWKEISFVTEPNTVRLICPKCRGVIVELVTGVLMVQPNRVGNPSLNTYDITVSANNLLSTFKELNDKQLMMDPPQVGKDDGLLHIKIHSAKELSFDRLRSENKIVQWNKVEA